MRKWMWLINLIFLLFSSQLLAAEKAIVLNITGAIGPATQNYIERGIAYAKDQQATLIILEINTPGGLETSMRGINEAIIKSPLPIIAYVTPAGARAASAGVFIMYASHLSVMTPGTNIGAASPVSLTPTQHKGSATKEISTEEKKAVNDAAAYIRSLAQLRGRNSQWAELAVREAQSISALDAKKLNVIEEIANDYPELLNKINGHSVKILGGEKNLQTKHLQLEKKPPDWRYQFLAFLTNPNMIYLLMLLAIYGLFFELSNPGLILPGVAGVIALLLLFYALQLAPINYIGLALVLLGITFMIAEVFIGSFGIIGIGGVVAFIIGSIMLFDVNNPSYRIAFSLILTMSAITLAFFFIVLNLAFKSHKKIIVSGQEGLIGAEGVVLSINNNLVVVRVLGEMWNAKSDVELQIGQRIKVTNVRGLVLTVIPNDKTVRKYLGD